jgi:hypothetical protein
MNTNKSLEKQLEELVDYTIFEDVEWYNGLIEDVGKELKRLLKEKLGLDCEVWWLKDELSLPDYLAICNDGSRIGINVEFPEDTRTIRVVNAFIANDWVNDPRPFYRQVA